MKKKNLKTLTLNKKVMSNFQFSIVGGIISGDCPGTYMCPMRPLDMPLNPMNPIDEDPLPGSFIC